MKCNRAEIDDWVIDYLMQSKYASASVVDQPFHDKFYAKFGGKRTETNYGAQPVHKAMSCLTRLYKAGILKRSRVSIDWRLEGFPPWVYSYQMNETYRQLRLGKAD